MGDQDPPSDASRRTLSEISHLFLSDVRDRHMGGASRPQRIPPGHQAQGQPAPAPLDENRLDVASDKLGSIYPASDALPADQDDQPTAPPITVVISAQGEMREARIRQYSRFLAGRVGRLGLIEIEADGLSVRCIDPTCERHDVSEPQEGAAADDVRDARVLDEAIEEMSSDIGLWLLTVRDLRVPAARALLSHASHFVLLSTCDHDGVVSSYRILKGLCDQGTEERPRLTLALMNAATTAEAASVYRKLADVCDQFLGWPLEAEPVVSYATTAVNAEPADFQVLRFYAQPTVPAMVQAPEAPHFAVIRDLLDRSETPHPLTIQFPLATLPADLADSAYQESAPEAYLPRPAFADRQVRTESPVPSDETARFAAEPNVVEAPVPSKAESTAPSGAEVPVPSGVEAARGSLPPAPAQSLSEQFMSPPLPRSSNVPPLRLAQRERGRDASDVADVIEIAGDTISADAILSAVLGKLNLIECPIRPPGCGSARLVVGRDRRICLLAVSLEGLGELRKIGQAWRWLSENLNLIAMAVPQLAIDTHNPPQLRLMVDQADISADVLRPIVSAGHVTVETYRKLRWNGRPGLLLDAA